MTDFKMEPLVRTHGDSKIVAVDIDGTLTVETEGFGDKVYYHRTPREDIIKKVNELYASGCIIIIWTARYPEDEFVTKQWLKNNGVNYHKLILGKLQYDYLVDDKSINPEDWKSDILHPFI